MRYTTAVIVTMLIIIVLLFPLSAESYIKDTLGEVKEGAFGKVSHLEQPMIQNLKKAFTSAKAHGYDAPHYTIRNKGNNTYEVEILFDKYSKDERDFGSVKFNHLT